MDLNDEPPHRVADARYITTEFIRALVRVPMTAKNVNCRKLNVSTSRVQDNKSRPRTYRMKRDGAPYSKKVSEVCLERRISI